MWHKLHFTIIAEAYLVIFKQKYNVICHVYCLTLDKIDIQAYRTKFL